MYTSQSGGVVKLVKLEAVLRTGGSRQRTRGGPHGNARVRARATEPKSMPVDEDLVDWLNDLLDMRYSSLAQCADCVAYGQLLAALYPDCASRGPRFLVMEPSVQQQNYELVVDVLEKVCPQHVTLCI